MFTHRLPSVIAKKQMEKLRSNELNNNPSSRPVVILECEYYIKCYQPNGSKNICDACYTRATRIIDHDIEKECTRCHQVRPHTDFYRKQGKCRACYYQLCRKKKLDGYFFFYYLVDRARSHSKDRGDKGRKGASTFNITVDYIKQLWDFQGGLCYYSGIPMIPKPLSTWQCSLERLDPSKGYTVDNVVLVALEFNIPCQWGMRKLLEFLDPRVVSEQENRDIIRLIKESNADKPHSTARPGNTKYKWDDIKYENGIRYIWCKYCQIYQDSNGYITCLSDGCRDCRRDIMDRNKVSIRRRLKDILRHANDSTARRNLTRNEDNKNTITLDNLREMLYNQRGRCAYSGMVLSYQGRHIDWCISLERKNVNQSYHVDNIMLIAAEFQGMDTSAGKGPDVNSGGWTHEKIAFFRKHAEETGLVNKLKGIVGPVDMNRAYEVDGNVELVEGKDEIVESIFAPEDTLIARLRKLRG